jgi:hypothetical protein
LPCVRAGFSWVVAGRRAATVVANRADGPLAHVPSGVFAANAAWLAIAAMAPNLLRAAGALASLPYAKARAATIRRDLIAVAARTARHGSGHLTLHLLHRGKLLVQESGRKRPTGIGRWIEAEKVYTWLGRFQGDRVALHPPIAKVGPPATRSLPTCRRPRCSWQRGTAGISSGLAGRHRA